MISRIALIAFAASAVLQGAEPAPWNSYRTIMWIGDTAYQKPEKLPLFFTRLQEMGVNTAMVHGEASPQVVLEAGMPYYLENMVNKGLCLKWNSKVVDWDKHVTQWKEQRSESELIREYSLDDSEWQRWAVEKVQNLAKRHAPQHPVAYNLRDELSVTMSANPFDYDFSESALVGFRQWLKSTYGSIETLNAHWDTDFKDWESVRPFTSDQIKNRISGGRGNGLNGAGVPRSKPDWQALQKVRFDSSSAHSDPLKWNLSPWCDHRTYMDISLSRELDRQRHAIREIDPMTPVGIEGTQMPAAFGGYDLSRLSKVLDWVEPYDIGNAREIFGSFMPGKPILTTVGEQDAKSAQRRLWHLLLEGDKGCIIWWSEDCIDWKSEEYHLTPRAAALTPVMKEMTSPLAQVILRAERESDPVAIHYSQTSIQVDWLMESCEDGSTWLRRFSSYEAAHSRMTRRRQAWTKLLQDMGYTPRFISSEQIATGALQNFKILVLGNSYACSDDEMREFETFLAKKGEMILGSGEFGVFDEHGKLRERPLTFGIPFNGTGESGTWQVWHEGGKPRGDLTGTDISAGLQRRGTDEPSIDVAKVQAIVPPFVCVPPKLGVRTHRLKVGEGARVIAFERNVVWQMGEDLKQHGGNDALEKEVVFEATLQTPKHIYELPSGKYFGYADRVPVSLDPWHPSLFALFDTKLPSGGDIVEMLSGH